VCLRRGGRRGGFEAVPSSNRWGLALCLWCLNPAVVFKSLSEVARSVLLTSGTLSPLDSFSGELGLNFHIKLEAPHVVDMHRQVGSRSTSCDSTPAVPACVCIT
jgi:Fanconi anemia group J protein